MVEVTGSSPVPPRVILGSEGLNWTYTSFRSLQVISPLTLLRAMNNNLRRINESRLEREKKEEIKTSLPQAPQGARKGKTKISPTGSPARLMFLSLPVCDSVA